jgi:uncharacterized protein (DUF58 family)
MKLTREGKRFLLAAVLIAVAAVNTGNNLIYLILSLMLSFIALSYLILRLNLAGLVLDVSVAGSVFAGEEVDLELLVHNNKKIPVYSVIIATADSTEQVYCEEISGRGVFRGRIRMVFKKRGLYGYKDFVVQSGFPFILFRKSMSVNVACQVLVYPKLCDIRDMLEVIASRQKEGVVAVRGSGDEIYSLRDYQYGDDWRRIHWKASARQDRFFIREYAEYASQNITILLDNLLPHDRELFETVVSISASIAQHFIEWGYSVRLLASGKTIPFGGGNEHLRSVLDMLALIAEQEGEWDFAVFRTEGVSIAVLKSAESNLGAEAASADLVIHADTL